MTRLGDVDRSWLRGKKRVAAPILVLIVTLALSFAAAGCGRVVETGETTETSTTSSSLPSAAPTSASGDALVSPAEQVASKVAPSVVHVQVEGATQSFSGSQQYQGEGSGVIFSANGMIVTNNHVVTEDSTPASKITVILATGQELPATIVGRDPVTDLAVIKIDRTDLPPADFLTDLSQVKIGEYAIAIGSPFGFSNSVTLGIVSGLHRDVPTSTASRMALTDLIQTDAPISPGNSGGALVDAQGRVIGINVAHLAPGQTGAENIGFAIPSDVVADVAQQIISSGKATHAYLGVRTQNVTAELQQRFGLSRSSGVLVAQLDGGTPAERAGISQGDIIIKIDDKTIEQDTDLFSFLRKKKVGQVVNVTVDRDGKTMSFKVTLGERPAG